MTDVMRSAIIWGGNILSPKSVVLTAKLEKAKAKGLVTKLAKCTLFYFLYIKITKILLQKKSIFGKEKQ